MSDVGSWDPGDRVTLSARHLECLRRAGKHLDAADFGLDEAELRSLAPLMSLDADQWDAAAREEDALELVAWIRFFTLAEARLPGFEAGAKSPVIPLARVLRQRHEYPPDLTAWIRAHSDNRFLPHGSLLDRL
ncbi:MAG: hypothetical protein F4X36_06840 [Gammaproteobacteria bacterium]|nr:hypothetical protein [Gammaproteobacteria bacterium]